MDEWVTYRIAAWDTPLWALPNRSAGRYNHAGRDQTQYLALHPLTPWAEVARRERRIGRHDLDELRLPIWAVRVLLTEAPERIDFDSAASWGLNPEDLVSDDRTACQALADRLRADPHGPRAIIVPSAALPGTENLVVLGPRVLMPYLGVPLDQQDTPVSIIAEEAVTPIGLEAMIHPIESPNEHPGLIAWRNGDRLELSEPATDHLR